VLIVTQKYHLYRALYIAEKLGINAYGISANLRTYTKQLKFDVREILARVKDVFWVQYNLK
jgi:vancomycin permeability regulator SanA